MTRILKDLSCTEPAAPAPSEVTCGKDGALKEPDTPAGHSVSTAASGVLGAQPMYGGKEAQRVGLYDVFAPPGPLGIVVDTSHDGPVIHSMKPASSLAGLVSAGDIIVGLDDMDTRSMTAATLTRLMAKRSLQPERKLTLLAVDANNDSTRF